MTTTRIGRPPKDINPRHVERMAAIGCTNVEIADVLGCDEGVIRRRFAEVLVRARGKMRESIRRVQFKQAMDGDRTMLIWLGKQYLDQQDVQTYRVQDLTKLSDAELTALAAGKVPA